MTTAQCTQKYATYTCSLGVFATVCQASGGCPGLCISENLWTPLSNKHR